MARSQETFNKKEIRNKKEKKKKEKAQKRLQKKENSSKSSFDDMIAYVDENGMITSTPPEPDKKSKIKAEDIAVSTPKQEDIEIDPIRKGVVQFFNDDKGYGFIKDSETKETIFVHINNVLEPIGDNNLVTFEIGSGPKGPTAINVKRVK